MNAGDFILGSVVRFAFTTHTAATGAPVAPSSAFANTDFRIYKDGSSAEKTTVNGITVTSPFDGVTGRHLIEIDTNISTGDTGFWAVGSSYSVELNTAKTVDSQTVSGLQIGAFSIEARNNRVDVRQFGGTNGAFASGRPEVNATHVAGTSQTAGDLAALLTAIDDYVDSEVAAIKAKTDNLPNDPADASDISSAFGTVNSTLGTIAGYIDTEVGAIKAKTDTLPASPAAAGDIPSAATVATAVRSELGAELGRIDVAISTRLAASWAAGITLLKNWLGALAGKTADTSTRAEINATTAGAGYNETTDSQEAIRDRGDAAWTTGAGGGGGGSTVESFSAGALQQLAGLKVTLKSPTLRGAVFDPPLIRGRDYSASDSNSLDVNVSGWTDFTGATVALVGTLRDEDGVVRESISWAGSVVNAGEATQTLRFQPTASQTTIARGNYECETVVTLGSGRVVSPAGVFVLPVIGA